MKVLHIGSGASGGATVALHRISKALSDIGVDNGILEPPAEFRFPIWWRAGRKILHLSGKTPFSNNPCPVYSDNLFSRLNAADINRQDVDLVHLHWIGGWGLGIAELAKIEKPIVWTVHDHWPFCGTEHYPDVLHGDYRYRDGYSRINFPSENFGVDCDKWIWRWKKFCWRKKHFYFVAPSHGCAKRLQESKLFFGQPCEVIPNSVDATVFHPLDKMQCKAHWGVPQEGKTVLFGAVDLTSPIKGGQYLSEILQYFAKNTIADCDKINLICFGDNGEAFLKEQNLSGLVVGKITEPAEMASLYNAADVFIAPSIIETFGNVHLESIFCQTPVVSFRVDGPSDFIEHGKNGYLAKPYEVDDLLHGVIDCLTNHPRVTQAEYNSFIQRFSPKKIAEQYKSFYERTLRDFKTR